VAAEDWVRARAELSQCDYPIPEDDRITRAEWDFCDARVALSEGDLTRTGTAVAGFESVPQSLSANRRAACLAITLRLHLARGARSDLIRTMVGDLEALHLVNRDLGTQDFETVALCLGLIALGNREQARHYLSEYLQKYRMSRRRLTKEIEDLWLTEGKVTSNRSDRRTFIGCKG